MIRIDQMFSSLGYGSRRQAREWIQAGRITTKGVQVTDPGMKVNPPDVRIDGEPPDHPEGLLLLLHKPLGLVCSHNPGEGPSVYSLLPDRWSRRNPPVTSIGRLDKDTSGLLILTDQGERVHQLTSPRNKVPKVYRAKLDRVPTPDLAPCFAAGMLVLPGESEPCAPAELRIVDAHEIELTLTEGRYRQVRRMLATQGYQVVDLHRIRFGCMDLPADLPAGKWIELPLTAFDPPVRRP